MERADSGLSMKSSVTALHCEDAVNTGRQRTKLFLPRQEIFQIKGIRMEKKIIRTPYTVENYPLLIIFNNNC